MDPNIETAFRLIINAESMLVAARSFQGFKMLASVVIPATVSKIGSRAFADCKQLEAVKFLAQPAAGASTIVIESGAFSGCASLNSLDLSSLVTDIGDHAFLGCARLMTVTIPGRNVVLGRETFKGCTSLSYISISETATIGHNAFIDCPAMDLNKSCVMMSHGKIVLTIKELQLLIGTDSAPTTATASAAAAASSMTSADLLATMLPDASTLTAPAAAAPFSSWAGCAALSVPAEAQGTSSTRVDTDGGDYTEEEFVGLYGGLDEWHAAAPLGAERDSDGSHGTRGANEDSGDETDVGDGAARRKDPADGKYYTQEEFVICYNGFAEWNTAGDTRTWENDWVCPDPSCNNQNFHYRTTCNMCNVQKPASPQHSSPSCRSSARGRGAGVGGNRSSSSSARDSSDRDDDGDGGGSSFYKRDPTASRANSKVKGIYKGQRSTPLVVVGRGAPRVPASTSTGSKVTATPQPPKPKPSKSKSQAGRGSAHAVTPSEIKALLKEHNWRSTMKGTISTKRQSKKGGADVYVLKREGSTEKITIQWSNLDNHGQ